MLKHLFTTKQFFITYFIPLHLQYIAFKEITSNYNKPQINTVKSLFLNRQKI